MHNTLYLASAEKIRHVSKYTHKNNRYMISCSLLRIWEVSESPVCVIYMSIPINVRRDSQTIYLRQAMIRVISWKRVPWSGYVIKPGMTAAYPILNYSIRTSYIRDPISLSPILLILSQTSNWEFETLSIVFGSCGE